jgi:hypothetical protein
MLLPPGGTSAAAADAITARAIPVTPPEAPAPYPASTLERISRPASRTGLWLALLAALAIGLGALVVLTSLRGTGRAGGSPTPSAAPKATRSASASAAPSPTPKPTADAFAPARSRLADLRDAIAAASGGHGIKGREANELQALLAQEQGALDAHDAGAARATADQLIQTINDDIQNDKIGEDQARSLVAAAQALRGAVARL